MLGAGLDGIERELPLPPPVEENAFEMSEEERDRRGVLMLPGSLDEAIDVAATSTLLRDVLGDHVFESLLKNKRIEWDRFRRHVTDFELAEYLPVL
jgi:glutamine synthetase